METRMIHCNSEFLVTNNEYRNTEIAQAVDIMIAWAKRIYIFMIKVNKLFLLICCGIFKRKYVLRVSNRKSCGNICLLMFTPHFLFSQTPICVFSCSIETLLFIQTNVNLSRVKTDKLILLWDAVQTLLAIINNQFKNLKMWSKPAGVVYDSSCCH